MKSIAIRYSVGPSPEAPDKLNRRIFMARYIGQRIMTPTPGRLQQVVNSQVGIFQSTDRRGSVAIAISGTEQDEVATNFIYDSISEAEAHQDGVLGDTVRLSGVDARGVDCVRTRWALSRVIEPTVRPSQPKYIRRNLITAKRGELGNLVNALKELREVFTTVTPGIVVQLGGNNDTVRTLAIVSSLEELEAWSDELASDKTKTYRDRIAGMTVGQHSVLSRFVHVNQS
tara:strand:+ start:31 stop:717 length:687 start_codon:yes stop_codon:yes gene_type:complete